MKQLRAERFPDMMRDGFFFQNTYGRKLVANLHEHDFYEILYVVQGGYEHSLNGQIAYCPVGTMTMMRMGDIHGILTQEVDTHVAALSITQGEMQKFVHAYALEAHPFFLKGKVCDFPRFFSLTLTERLELERFFRDHDGHHSMDSRVLLGKFLSYYLRFQNAKHPSISLPANMADLLCHMRQTENMVGGVKRMQELSHYSHAQLCRLFRKYLGETPQEYIQKLRLEKAIELIENSAIDFLQISEIVGFSSYSHFYRLLRKQSGVSPSELRKCACHRQSTL